MLTQSSVGMKPFLAPGKLCVELMEDTLDCRIGCITLEETLELLETRERDPSGSFPLAFSDKRFVLVTESVGEHMACESSMDCLCIRFSFV